MMYLSGLSLLLHTSVTPITGQLDFKTQRRFLPVEPITALKNPAECVFCVYVTYLQSPSFALDVTFCCKLIWIKGRNEYIVAMVT
jgi:hypothetical protein